MGEVESPPSGRVQPESGEVESLLDGNIPEAADN
jgi:hypothetical protein